MNNPWLDVPLEEYEGHMAWPAVGQAQLLSDVFSRVIEQFSPRSVAVLGCAGGLDFADAELVFAGVTLEVEDTRKNYGEVRIICYGLLDGRMVVLGYTPRGADRHIFSMRKANEREKARIAPRLEV